MNVTCICCLSYKIIYQSLQLMLLLIINSIERFCKKKTAGGHILWLVEVVVPPPALLTYLCPGRPCFSSSDVFLFCWAAFLSISLLASVFPVSLPLFFLFLRPFLIHARMPDWGRAFVHGHTFLHSWTHFLAFMDTLSCIHGHTFLHCCNILSLI